MSENTFIKRINKYVVSYKEKTNNPYRGGTPDVYYEDKKHLWIEYKFVVVPKRKQTLVKINLSELQKLWLKRCHENTGRARVIVGCKSGGAVFETPQEWDSSISAEDFAKRVVPHLQLSLYIDQLCRQV